MSEPKTPIVYIATQLGTPNTCPLCDQDWTKNGCVHQTYTAEDLSVRAQLALLNKLKKRDTEELPPRRGAEVWVPVANQYKYWPSTDRFPLNTRVRTTHRVTDDGVWQRPSERRWGVTGTIINRNDAHGVCYVVRHDDGTEAGYDPRELSEVTT